MTRRALLSTVLLARNTEPKAPTEEATINAFATAFNKYTAQLTKGTVDVRLWRDVLRRWRGLGA